MRDIGPIHFFGRKNQVAHIFYVKNSSCFFFLLITRFLLFFSLTSPLDCHLKNYFYQISCSNYCNNPTGCGLNDDAIAIVAISHSISLKFLHLVALLAKNMIFVDIFQLCDFSSFFAYLLRQLHYQFVFMRS